MAETISPDYLVVGAGAMGMAFVDTLLTDSKATVAIVDRYHRPGGHWLMAYPFVHLHQPSAFYGVNSKHLGQDSIDQVGWNSGLNELATADEVCAYYDQLINQRFLPSGRVAYYPNCEYEGDGQFRSKLAGKKFQVGKNTRFVDATYMRVVVPSMRPPSYTAASGVHLVTPNDLIKVSQPYDHYTVVGSGKTGIDACLWLLGAGIAPSQITWIMPRDAWLLDRGVIQPGKQFAQRTHEGVMGQSEAIMAATSVQDLFKRLEACGQLLRVDTKIEPTMFRCATVSRKELEAIRTIRTIVRKGRISHISLDEITLEGGKHSITPNTLFVDCTADGLAKNRSVPVFQGNKITLQPVRFCQQVFSAAFIAHIEATYENEIEKNELCLPVPHPDDAVDWLIVTLLTYRNALRWDTKPKTAEWLGEARLNWFKSFSPPLPEDPQQRKAALEMIGERVMGQCDKLQKLLENLPKEEAAKAMAQVARTKL